MKIRWAKITRRLWAWAPEQWLRRHILNSERRWSGKGMSEEELAEYVANARRFR